jgi:small conductance mechanosensitive channel
MEFGSRAIEAIGLAAVWIAVIIGVNLALGFGLRRYERHLAEQAQEDRRAVARRRTSISLLPRLVTVFLFLIGSWSVLSLFPETADAARAVLLSSTVVALVLGLALTNPLGNLGSGVLLVLTQPARLDDRISVVIPSSLTHTGRVDKISLAFTTLVTDEGRKIFVPNQMMIQNVVINHSRGDRRRAVSLRLPVAIDAAIEDACRVAFEAARAVEKEAGEGLELRILVTDVTETAIWLEIAGFAPVNVDVAVTATEIRKRALAGLLDKELLPAPRPVAAQAHPRFEE